MNKDAELIFSQSLISYLANINQATISRYIAQKGFNHIEKFGDKRKKYTLEVARQIFKKLLIHNLKPKIKTQVFFNFKGGTGKTSLCHQVSVMFAAFGFKVLVIDCDPQAHLSYSLGFNENDDYPTLYDVIVNKVLMSDVIHYGVYCGLDVIPSNLSLTRLEAALNQMPNREKMLSKTLEQLKDNYDFIFIDTNPTISTLNRNATLAADMLNIVCETQPYSLRGMEMLIQELEYFSEVMDKKITYQIIPNKYESKTATSQEVLGALRHNYKEHVMESIVRKCEDFNISSKRKIPLFGFCNKKSIALEDIKDLTNQLLSKSTETINNQEKLDNAI
jgi:chromosome partitioning protein